MALPQRKENRLKHYDYSQNGAYFITICTHERSNRFGQIIVGEGFPLPQVRLNVAGKIVEQSIQFIPQKYAGIEVDCFTVMPNHVHLLLCIKNGTGNPSPTIGTVVGWLKYQTTKQINAVHKTQGQKQWQRSYHDHVVRGEKGYQTIWEYIDTNPLKWAEDCYYNEELPGASLCEKQGETT